MAKQKPDDAVGLNIGRNANNAAAWLNQQKENRVEAAPPAPATAIPAAETEVAPVPVVAAPELKADRPSRPAESANTPQPSSTKGIARGTGKNSPQLTLTKPTAMDEEAYWEPFINSRGFERPTKNLLITERVHGVINMIARVATTEHKHRMTLNEVLEVIVLSHVEDNKAVLAKIQERWKNRQEWL